MWFSNLKIGHKWYFRFFFFLSYNHISFLYTVYISICQTALSTNLPSCSQWLLEMYSGMDLRRAESIMIRWSLWISRKDLASFLFLSKQIVLLCSVCCVCIQSDPTLDLNSTVEIYNRLFFHSPITVCILLLWEWVYLLSYSLANYCLVFVHASLLISLCVYECYIDSVWSLWP